MNNLQFVTLLYSYLFPFFLVCFFVCVHVHGCVCARLWDGCLKTSASVQHILRILSQVSTLSQHGVQCRTHSLLSSNSEVFVTSHRELTIEQWSLKIRLTPATHNVCVSVWSIYDYMHHVCMYHGIANMHKHIYLFI